MSVDISKGGRKVSAPVVLWWFCAHHKLSPVVVAIYFRFYSSTGSLAKANNFCALRPKEIAAVRLCSGHNGGDDGRITREVPVDESSSDSYEQDIKSKILQSSLPYVPEHGWSRDTVAAGIPIVFLDQWSVNGHSHSGGSAECF